MKFKVGDKVKLRNNCSGSTRGTVYTLQYGDVYKGNLNLLYAWDRDTRNCGCSCERNWELVTEAVKPETPKFAVGDKVRIISLKGRGIDSDEICNQDNLGKVFIVGELGRKYAVLRNSSGYYECCIWNYNLELVEENNGFTDYPVYKTPYHAYQGWNDYNNVESSTTVKKEQSIMSKVVDYVKNSLLSADEKLLRKHGLKDECGEYTSEAREIAIQKLMQECDSYFIEVAKGLEEENNKNK